MIKQKKNNNFIIITVLAVLSLVMFVFNVISHSTLKNSSSGLKSSNAGTYTSKTMHIAIRIPDGYSSSTGVNSIFLTNKLGEIRIVEQGTNYKNINDYLSSLNLELSNENRVTINGYPAINAMMAEKKSYFIYPAQWVVYSLSTSSPALYGDLDKIAQSFQYNP